MKATNMYIYMNDLRIHAFHGVNPQEQKVGSDFIISIRLKTDFTQAAQTDELCETINYADVFDTIKDEMKRPSKLLEHVCKRITERLLSSYETIEEVKIRLQKENPPIGADCKEVGVEVTYLR